MPEGWVCSRSRHALSSPVATHRAQGHKAQQRRLQAAVGARPPPPHMTSTAAPTLILVDIFLVKLFLLSSTGASTTPRSSWGTAWVALMFAWGGLPGLRGACKVGSHLGESGNSVRGGLRCGRGLKG